MKRIGVFVCSCGSNIEGTVDVKKVVEAMSKEPYVVYAANCKYMCSSSGQELIKNAIKETKRHGLINFPFEVYRVRLPETFPQFPIHYHEEF